MESSLVTEVAIQHHDLILQRNYSRTLRSGCPLLARDGELGHRPAHETIPPNTGC